MKKKIIIDANYPMETRVVLLDNNNNIERTLFSSENRKQLKGNIYLAKVMRVEPSLQAAFVDYGGDKNGFLPFSEIHPDYYHLPSKDGQERALSGDKIDEPEITQDDLSDKVEKANFQKLLEDEDINVNAIEQMVENKIPSDINIDAEDDEIDPFQNNKNQKLLDYKIQEVIKKGQIILVQVTKEERGNKGASLTSYISLAGKYCVLMPNKPSHNGISKKISNSDERKRIKKIITNLISDSDTSAFSVIARTAAIGHTSLEIKKDYEYLARLWNKIRETTIQSEAPCFIHQEDGIILKTIRDVFDRTVKEIVVQGGKAYSDCIKFMKDILPGSEKFVKDYRGKAPIFTKYAIEDQLIKLYQPIAHLPSGGYIVINPTEALISIDVNSGKATSERNVEKMALKTNLEAAREISKQAQLRELSGLLVIDFIDLAETKNKKVLERSLWEFFSKDKARIQTSSISNFGLLEMSRQRIYPSFLEINSNMCSHCSGKGVVRADDSNSMLILRTIENEIYNGKYDVINVYGVSSSIIYLMNNMRNEILLIEKKYSIKINLFIDRDATSDSYSIEKIKLSEKNKTHTKISSEVPALQDTSAIYNQDVKSDSDNTKSKKTSSLKQKRKIDKTAKTQEVEKISPTKKKVKSNKEENIDKDSSITQSEEVKAQKSSVKPSSVAKKKIVKKSKTS